MGSNPKMTMTYLVTNRSWQLADLSRTVDDGMLVFECERRNLPPDCIPGDATELRVNLQLVLKALLDLLRGAGGEVILSLSSHRRALVSVSVVDALRTSMTEDR